MSIDDKKIQYTIEAIDKTDNGINSVIDNTDKLTKKAFALNQAFELTKNVFGAVKRVWETAYAPASALSEAVERQSLILGISTKEMQKWNFVATQNKTSTEAVTFAFTQLTMKAYDAYAGNKEALKSFQMLGVAVRDSEGNLRSNESIINDTIKSLSGMSSESKRAALAQDIFGRAGKELLPMLSQGTEGINNQRDAAEKLGQVLSDKAVKSFTETNDALDRMKTALAVAGGELLTTFLPTMQKVVDTATAAASALSKAFKTPSEMEFFSEKLTQLREERAALFSAGGKPSDTKLEMLQDEIMYYERKYNMLVALSKISDADKGSQTEGGGLLNEQISTGGETKKGPDFDLYARSIGLDVTTYKENEKATKEVQDRVVAYTKEQREALLNDAAEKGEKYKALEAALADSKVTAIADQKERELAEAELWYQRELTMYEDIGNSKSMIDEMHAAKKKEIDEAATKRSLDLAEKEKRMKIQNFQMVGGAFNELMGAIGDASKENAKAQKSIAIIQAIINTALGVTQAIAQGGIAGIVTGAIVAAAGAVQVATIASQNFALGGVAKRNPGAVSDAVNINVNPDERIVTKRQQNNLTRFLNNPEGGSRGDTYNIYDTSGDLVETLVTKIRNGAGDKLINVLNSRYALA